MTEHEEGTFQGTHGLELYYQRWRPESTRATVAVIHGFGEHSGRYMNIVNHLVPKGYAVYGFDHRGHGRSPGPRGHVGRWTEFQKDVRRFVQLVEAQEPDRPVFLLGHSMGGLIALEYALHHPEGLRGVIASAPLLTQAGISPVLLRLSRVASRVWPRFSMNTRIQSGVISRDPDVLKALREDPLVHNRGSARLGTEMTAAIARTHARAGELQLPLLLIHGTADRLVPIDGSRKFFGRVTFPDREFRPYECVYHEPHNDTDHARVLADVEDWLERHL